MHLLLYFVVFYVCYRYIRATVFIAKAVYSGKRHWVLRESWKIWRSDRPLKQKIKDDCNLGFENIKWGLSQ